MGQPGSFHMHTSTDSSATPVQIANSGDKNDWRLTISNNFGVDESGQLFATNASISGAIAVSEGGTIGGWYVGEKSLYTKELDLGENGSFHLHTADQEDKTTIAGASLKSWRLGIGNSFGVASDGSLYGSKVYLKGGEIGGWKLGAQYLITANQELGKDGSFHLYTTDQEDRTTIAGANLNNWRLGIGTSFGVTSDGSLYGNKVHLDGGKIGGWELGEYSLITANYSLG